MPEGVVTNQPEPLPPGEVFRNEGPSVEDPLAPPLKSRTTEPKEAPKEAPKAEGDVKTILTQAAAPLIQYKDFTVPDDVELSPDTVKEFTSTLSALDVNDKGQITQQGAQQLVDFYINLAKKEADQSYRDWQETVKSWDGEVRKDPELGGANFPKMKQTIQHAMRLFGSAEAGEAFDFTGAGSNPHILRMIYRMASRLIEPATAVSGDPPATVPKSLAEVMFPNQAKG